MSTNILSEEKIARAAWRLIPGIGSQHLRHLIAYFGSAHQAWIVPVQELIRLGAEPWIREACLKRKSITLDQVAEDLEKKGIWIAIPGDGCYPNILAELADAPPLLYYRGSMLASSEALAIVGARKATAYGKAAAIYIAKEIVERDIVIVSGLARGIDTAAHQGALAGKGMTWAVLASGVDWIYPPENRRLAEEIIDFGGAIISDFIPGTNPQPQFFPARNRLISGCSRGVVVVEAAQKSGALITVDFALEQGREVFAVPGPIFSEMSKGTHQLLRQGAILIEGIEDIWREVSVWQDGQNTGRATSIPAASFIPGNQSKNRKTSHQEVKQESIIYQMVFELLSDQPLHIDQILLGCDMQPQELALTLLELELSGRILQLPGQHYVLSRN